MWPKMAPTKNIGGSSDDGIRALRCVRVLRSGGRSRSLGREAPRSLERPPLFFLSSARHYFGADLNYSPSRDSQNLSCAERQIDNATANERAPVVHGNNHA